ncbi:MAG: response regulator transcription factor [Tannerellaceae bacterium]|jgi:DNA-binding response OmpR family regulator|nr:response regulator transcription factor [Tannerellaceae bacterium]
MTTNERFKILLFERNDSIGQLLCEFMYMSDLSADLYTDPEAAYQAFTTGDYSICIINIDESTLQEDFMLVKKIKSCSSDVLLIFLASAPTPEILALAYAAGADDFVRKPFILEELQMRIAAVIRRSRIFENTHVPTYRIGKYLFEPKNQTLTIDDLCSKITTKESELLQYLCEHMNVLVLREDILKTVWKRNSYYNARSMDVYITKLRRLLKNDNRVGIVNVHGKGYKLLVV